ncbi:MAG: PAS domain S-box protein, partial [Armatimonadia bacterium]|nr:PAS domain S-box protein [Armatimonadia bacterium]
VAERTRELADSRDELRVQRDFVDAVIEEAGSLVVVVDAHGAIVRFNHAAEEVSGWSANEVRGRNFLELLIPEDEREQVRGDFFGQLREGPAQYENWWRRKSGGRRRISWRLSIIPDELGEMEFMIGTGWDVTEERRMARELRDSEEKYRELVENARTIIIRWDLDGTIRFVNEYGLEFFGYTEDELVGEHVGIIVADVDSHGRDVGGIVEAIAARPGEYETVEAENVARDGSRYWVSWSNRVIRDDEGEIAGILAIGVDRTAQRHAEGQLRASREDLRELTAELAMAEQRERREVATVLHDNIGQLLAFTKMKISAMASQDLVAPSDFAQLQRFMEEIIAETRSITNQLAPPVLVQLEFFRALRWLADEFASRQEIAVTFESEGDAGPISDELSVTLFQATRELLVNAIKHAEPGQVTVHAGVKDDSVCIEVADDGRGFDPSTLSGGLRREGGFGLFNVRERISYLGGHVDIQSAPGEGTTITLVCPIAAGETNRS